MASSDILTDLHCLLDICGDLTTFSMFPAASLMSGVAFMAFLTSVMDSAATCLTLWLPLGPSSLSRQCSWPSWHPWETLRPFSYLQQPSLPFSCSRQPSCALADWKSLLTVPQKCFEIFRRTVKPYYFLKQWRNSQNLRNGPCQCVCI